MFKPQLHINSAVQSRSRVDLSCRTLTTAKIGQIFPIYHCPVVPGDKLQGNSNIFCRFEPLAVPSYVNLKLQTMTLFVPYHQLADGVDAFMSNMEYFKGKDTGLPRLTYAAVSAFFKDGRISSATSSTSIYDIKVDGGYYVLTPLGRFARKTFDNLGYRFGSELRSEVFVLNALPLLAYAHGYNSYMSYSSDYNVSSLSNLLESIKRNPTVTITASNLITLFSSILLCFENTFVTNAWNRPYSTQDLQSQVPVQDFIATVGSPSGTSFNASEGATTEAINGLTSSQVRMLMKFDDYFRRSAFSGSKDIEQIYSRFGVKIDDYRQRYPYFLNSSTQSVQIGDVTSTADTADASIGSYAGKAIASSNCQWSFDSKDYGMIITYAWFSPEVLYYTGIDKENLRLNPFDYYTPEFDAGFADVVSLAQIVDSKSRSTGWGYVPLYSEYLFGKDVVSGDFTRFAGFDAWHFGRSVSELQVAQSDALIYIPNTGSVYERIFNITDTSLVDADTCYLNVSNNIHALRPMRDFSGKTMLGDGSINMGANGSQIS